MDGLKIAMLVRKFSPHGGLELYAHKVVEGLLENGVSVTVLCQDRESDLEHRSLSFKILPSSNGKQGKRARLSSLFHFANEAVAQLEDVHLVHSQHCPTVSADVVTFHNHSTERLTEVGLWWERVLNETKRRLVPAYRMRDMHDEALLRRAHCLVFPAEVMKEDFYLSFPFLNGPPAKPYVVAHPGAAMAVPKGDTAVSLPENEPFPAPARPQAETFNFLFVGRGFRKKGLDILFSACRILKEKRQGNFKLLIAGLSAKPADRLRLSLLGIDDSVQYLGFQKDMKAVYAEAKVIVLPSRVEPFGMAPVQAMQNGLVPIVSRVSGVAEVLHDNDDALLLRDHLNAHELADLMSRLMHQPALLSRLSSAALKSSREISWQDTVKQTMKAYEIALSLKKSGEKTLSK